jgi:DNA-binding GntR family transcriptional regulator
VANTSKQNKMRLNEELKRAIMTMELKPGADFDEAALSAEYGLSRTPLREVFRQLAGEGYAEIHENKGVRVAEMSHHSLRNFFLTAPMIYAAVLRMAALNATADQIADLKAAQVAFKAAIAAGSSIDRMLANNLFHDITGDMAGNEYLRPSFNRLLIDHARISVTFYNPTDTKMQQSVQTASQHHDAIISAIEIRDEARAAHLASEHWNLSRDQIETFVMPSALDGQLGN